MMRFARTFSGNPPAAVAAALVALVCAGCAAAGPPKPAPIIDDGAAWPAPADDERVQITLAALAASPDDAAAAAAACAALGSRSAWVAAAVPCRKAAELAPGDLRAELRASDSAFRVRFYLDAIRAAQRASALAPDSAPTDFYLGRALFKLGRTDEAIDALEAAVAKADRRIDYRRVLASAYLETRNLAAALGHLEAASALAPEDAQTSGLLAETRAIVERRLGPIRAFAAEHPGDPAGNSALGAEYAAMGYYDKSLAHFDAALPALATVLPNAEQRTQAAARIEYSRGVALR